VNLKKLLLKTRKQAFSELLGNNPSPFKGEGYDFFELREYADGDDTRHIDWMVTAKKGTPYVKVFHKEHQINVVIASMLNGSVFFGSDRLKQELIAEVAALIAFSAVKNGDNFSNWIFADRCYHTTLPSKRIAAVHEAVEQIVNFDPLHKSASPNIIQNELITKLKRRSLIFVISDFFTPLELKVLAKKHEIIALVIRDRYEESLPELGETALIDPETGALFEGDASALKTHYEKRVKQIDRQFEKECHRLSIRFIKLYTHEDPFSKLARLFGR